MYTVTVFPGSTRSTAFPGRTCRPEMDAEMKRASGAAAIRSVRPTGGSSGGPPVDRRLNVLLHESGILLDCGQAGEGRSGPRTAAP